jgi:D-alanyl-D-alanine carboxypeptidase (penicillin-binding protein 5/6)
VTLSMPREDRAALKAAVVLNEPVAAPVAAGQEIGKLRVTVPGTAPREYPLYAEANVAKLGFFGQMSAKLHHVFGDDEEKVAE